MGWRRTVVRGAARVAVHRLGDAIVSDPVAVRRRTRVDPDWRRVEDGYAARLGPHETIDVARPVGRWRQVDPRLPQDGWRSVWKTVGLGVWAGSVGISWWVGASRGRGPLRVLRDDPPWG